MHKLIALLLLPWVVLVAHVPASLAVVEPATLSFGCVNVITGDYCEARTDMVVNCFEPIAIRRTHVSSDEVRNTGGIWRYGGETLTAYDTGNGIAFYLEEEGGGVVKFPSSSGAPDLGRTYCNTSGGELSGRTNLRNYRLSINGLRATLTTGSGERRIYEHLPDDAEIYYYLLRNKIIKGARWVLKEVIRPNGNRLIYDYTAPAVAQSGIVKHGFKIRATDRSGSTEFGWANYDYQVVPGANLLTVKTSEVRTLERYVQIVGTTSGSFRSGDLLQDVRGPGGYTEVYHYDTRGHDIPRSLQICGRHRPEGRERRIEYYRRGGTIHWGDASLY